MLSDFTIQRKNLFALRIYNKMLVRLEGDRCTCLSDPFATFEHVSNLTVPMITYIFYRMTMSASNDRGKAETVMGQLRDALLLKQTIRTRNGIEFVNTPDLPESTMKRVLSKLKKLAQIFKRDPRILKALTACVDDSKKKAALEMCRLSIIGKTMIPHPSFIVVGNLKSSIQEFFAGGSPDKLKRILNFPAEVDIISKHARQALLDVCTYVLRFHEEKNEEIDKNRVVEAYYKAFDSLLLHVGLDGIISNSVSVQVENRAVPAPRVVNKKNQGETRTKERSNNSTAKLPNKNDSQNTKDVVNLAFGQKKKNVKKNANLR